MIDFLNVRQRKKNTNSEILKQKVLLCRRMYLSFSHILIESIVYRKQSFIHIHFSLYSRALHTRSLTSSGLWVDVFARWVEGATVNLSDVVRWDEKGTCEVHVL
jgi:hypothetical protein